MTDPRACAQERSPWRRSNTASSNKVVRYLREMKPTTQPATRGVEEALRERTPMLPGSTMPLRKGRGSKQPGQRSVGRPGIQYCHVESISTLDTWNSGRSGATRAGALICTALPGEAPARGARYAVHATVYVGPIRPNCSTFEPVAWRLPAANEPPQGRSPRSSRTPIRPKEDSGKHKF